MSLIKKFFSIFAFSKRLPNPAEMSEEERLAEIADLADRIEKLEPKESGSGFNSSKTAYIRRQPQKGSPSVLFHPPRSKN